MYSYSSHETTFYPSIRYAIFAKIYNGNNVVCKVYYLYGREDKPLNVHCTTLAFLLRRFNDSILYIRLLSSTLYCVLAK